MLILKIDTSSELTERFWWYNVSNHSSNISEFMKMCRKYRSNLDLYLQNKYGLYDSDNILASRMEIVFLSINQMCVTLD